MAVSEILSTLEIERLDGVTTGTREVELGTKLSSLSGTGASEGASLLGIADAAGVFTGTSVEEALQELAGAGGSIVDLIFTASVEITLDTNGDAAVTQACHTVDTFSDAASDTVRQLTGGTANELLWIRPASAARTVILGHGIGADLIATPGARSISLAEGTDWACLAYDGTQWVVQSFNTLADAGGGLGVALASTANTDGASMVAIEDTGTSYTATDVEGALAELVDLGYTWKDQIFTAATEVTLDTNGDAAVTKAVHTVDTFADAASDTVRQLTGGTAEDLLLIRPADATRTVIIGHGIGADLVATPGARAISLAEATDWALLAYDGTQWICLAFSTLADAGGGLGVALASTANTDGASMIGIEDSAVQITATDVEGALAEHRALIDPNTTHLTNDGSDHSFLDQSVIISSTPTFVGTNFTGIPAAGVVAAASSTVGLIQHIKWSTPGGATANTDQALPTGTWELVDAWVVNQGAGTASDTLLIADDSGNAITNAIDISGADHTLARAGLVNDANAEGLVGGTDALRATETDGGGADSPAVDVHVTLRRTA